MISALNDRGRIDSVSATPDQTVTFGKNGRVPEQTACEARNDRPT